MSTQDFYSLYDFQNKFMFTPTQYRRNFGNSHVWPRNIYNESQNK